VTRAHRPDAAAIAARLARDLPPGRYAHSLAAARWAEGLAPAAGVAPSRAYMAALLHDCARDLSRPRAARLLRSYRGRHADAAVRAAPALWHAPLGALLARRRYGIGDPFVLRAIARHTLGGPRMTPLEQLVYLADYAEPRRTHPDSRRVRTLARRDPAAAFRAAVAGKLRYLAARRLTPHARTLALARELGLRAGRRVRPRRVP
jgi:predicted HD superfamily hydrolase involved in NAD metabolism